MFFRALILNNNGFIGTIPSGISSMTLLQRLSLASNNLVHAGTFPTWIGALSQLTSLELQSNVVASLPAASALSLLLSLTYENNNIIVSPTGTESCASLPDASFRMSTRSVFTNLFLPNLHGHCVSRFAANWTCRRAVWPEPFHPQCPRYGSWPS